MHYYKFNIGDYRKDTVHLSPMEHYIYRELIDWYYLDESPIPKKTQSVMRRLRLVSENEESLSLVLQEFFEEGEMGWVHHKIEAEICQYKAKAETARANGGKGGRPKKPKKTQPVNSRNPEETGSKANHKPLTINHNTNNTTSEKPDEGEKVKKFDPDDLALAEWMHQLILVKLPEFKKPNLESWAATIRLMRERDNRTYQGMETVWTWARNDSFWCKNIQSASKFREKYDQLTENMKVPIKTNGYMTAQEKRAARNAEIFDYDQARQF